VVDLSFERYRSFLGQLLGVWHEHLKEFPRCSIEFLSSRVQPHEQLHPRVPLEQNDRKLEECVI